MIAADDPHAPASGPIFLGPWAKLGFALGALLAAAHLYFALVADVSELTRNAIHFAGFAFLCAISYPLLKDTRSRWVDLGFGLAVASAALYLASAEVAIYDRGVRLSPADWIAGTVVILGAIELTRRTTGYIIPALIVLALSYVAFWGQHVGGIFRFPGLSLETVLFRSIYGDDALFGTIARISSTFVFPFIIFGAFLLRSGAGHFVIVLAQAVAGRFTGGPGLVSVIASGLTGTISGSAIANTASTGVITIPLMKRAGFPPRFAGAVEAASSTGGQLMPPIMGAGAFVMASYTQIPYEDIVVLAFLPALLYFASVAFFVRMEAKRQGLRPTSVEGPALSEELRGGGIRFLVPIALVIGVLIAGFTPQYAAVVGIFAVIGACWLTGSPMGLRAIAEALALGARNMTVTAVLLCAVGLVVNVIATAGVGNTFSLMISEWAGGNLLIAIVLIALASLVLGMGLPVTAAYIVLATLSAPALSAMIGDGLLAEALAAGTVPESAAAILMLGAPEAAASLGQGMSLAEARTLVAGLPLELVVALRAAVLPPEALAFALLSAHMIIFWLSQDSNVTPPICLAAFTAAAIAKAPPMGTGLVSWKLAKGLYIVPVLFAYTPLLSGDWLAAFTVFAFALAGIYALAGALQGWMEAPLTREMRVGAAALGIACLWPGIIAINLIGLLGLAALFAFHLWKEKPAVGSRVTESPTDPA